MDCSPVKNKSKNIIFLYDLPKEETNSKAIAIVFEKQAGIILDK